MAGWLSLYFHRKRIFIELTTENQNHEPQPHTDNAQLKEMAGEVFNLMDKDQDAAVTKEEFVQAHIQEVPSSSSLLLSSLELSDTTIYEP